MSPRSGRRCWLGVAALALGCAVLAGCATTKLAVVAVDGTRAQPDQMQAVRVLRGGRLLETQAGMTLQAGDRVETGPGASAVVSYGSGSRVYFGPESGATLGSLFDVIGQVFARVRGKFAIETDFVRAGAEGTAFLVRAERGRASTVIVLEGRVRCDSVGGSWAAVTVGPGQKLVAARDTAEPMPAPERELLEIQRWVDPLDELVPKGLSTGTVLGGVAVAAIVAAIVASAASGGDHGDRDGGRPGSQPPPAPAEAGPGSLHAGAPEPVDCRHFVLAWSSVRGATDYVVEIDAPSAHAVRRSTRPLTRETRDTRLELVQGDWLAGANSLRWHVQARDASGRASEPTRWRHLACQQVID